MSAPNSTELANSTPFPAPAAEAAEEVGSEEEDEKPVLPPELLLEIMKTIHASSIDKRNPDKQIWSRTLVTFVRASRFCHALGMPILLREVEFTSKRVVRSGLSTFANFLEDGLRSDKFSLVRKLSLCITGPRAASLCADLARKVGPALQELEISLEVIPPEDTWEGYKTLHALKKLTILASNSVNTPIPTVPRTPDDKHTCFHCLLHFAEKEWTQLEELRLNSRIADVQKWHRELAKSANLRRTLRFVAVHDSDLSEWTKIALPNLKEACVQDSGSFDRVAYPNWKKIDAFPGLTKLEITSAKTSELLLWPFRALKEMIISTCYPNLTESQYQIARKRVEDQGLTLTLCVAGEGEAAWMAEIKFWKTVKGVKVAHWRQ